MFLNERQRPYHSLQQILKPKAMYKSSIFGTLSSDTTGTTTTTSSGYSTGHSSLSTVKNSSLKKPSSSVSHKKCRQKEQQQQQQQQYKTKSKGLHNLLTKIKNLLLPSKSKYSSISRTMRPTASRQISTTNVLRQYHQYPTAYDKLPSSLSTNHMLSLPFTYYPNSPIRESRKTFHKISAWLDHTEKMTQPKSNSKHLLFVNMDQPKSLKHSSSFAVNNRVIPVMMKKSSAINIEPPKRSSSLTRKIIGPIIEARSERTASPTSSFSSSILTRGMSEGLISPIDKSVNYLSTSNRRKTIPNIREYNINKENLTKLITKQPSQVYRFSPVLSAKQHNEIYIPSLESSNTDKYYFHADSLKPNEDLLNNSYGLTILSQQQEPRRQRHSVATVLMISQIPNTVSAEKTNYSEEFIQNKPQQNHSDSWDDVLCDREVESYFYPKPTENEEFYKRFENVNDSNCASSSFVHGTLC